jgi:hypothetical protein
MKFKKLAALTGSAIMTGLALVGPVLAASVSAVGSAQDMVSVTDSTVDFPLFVIGEGAASSDVAGAVDVAVRWAAYAKSVSSVSVTGAAVGVAGGASMATATNPIVLWDNFASSKQVLTATDLPGILASGNYVDQGSVSVPYSQYLTFEDGVNNGRVVYDTRSGGTAPELGLKFTGSNVVYTYLLSFTKQISETVATNSAANMVNSQISMLGKDWTITGATSPSSNSFTLTMLSGKNAKTVTTEDPASFDVDGSEYTVSLVAVGTIGGNAAATVQVEGGGLSAPQTLQILSGATKTLNDGTLIGVTSIFTTTKQGAIDSATVFVGADKLELTDTDTTGGYYAGVKINGQTVNEVKVSMIGSAPGASGTLTLDQIQIQWTPSLEQFLAPGTSVTDPASKGFKIFFGGISPALDDSANRESISVTPSGTAGTLSFTTSDGHSVAQNFVKSTGIGATLVALQDAGSYALHILEGEIAAENEYVVLGRNSLAGNAQNPFGHIVRVLSLETSSSATSSLQDVASGATLTVTGGNTTMYLDGQAYKISVLNTTHCQITWGTSADYSDAGSGYDVYPAIMTSKGAWVSITAPVVLATSAVTNYVFNTPTGALTVNSTSGPQGLNTVNVAKYNVTAGGTYIRLAASDNDATAWGTPGILIVEGIDASTVRNMIAIRAAGDGSFNRVDLPDGPKFTGTKTSNPTVSGSTQNRYMDAFGSYVTYDSTMPGTFTVSYPSAQAQAIVGVGATPSSSGGGVGGSVTTETVLPITKDVVKLDTEVTESDKNGNDLVLFGGSCVNSMTAEVMDLAFPTCGADSGVPEDAAMIAVYEDHFAAGKSVLVIAGWSAADTDLAARVVQLGFPGATEAQKDSDELTVSGSVTSPAYA